MNKRVYNALRKVASMNKEAGAMDWYWNLWGKPTSVDAPAIPEYSRIGRSYKPYGGTAANYYIHPQTKEWKFATDPKDANKYRSMGFISTDTLLPKQQQQSATESLISTLRDAAPTARKLQQENKDLRPALNKIVGEENMKKVDDTLGKGSNLADKIENTVSRNPGLKTAADGFYNWAKKKYNEHEK